jgi:predicted outer membrane repeat protein
MRKKFMRTAIVAGTAAVAGLATASPALASPVPAVQVPCRVSALASAISGAPDGAVLRLASCTYLLTSALPDIHTRLTLQGGPASTIERRYGGSTPHFSLLSVGTGGNLTVTNVNFKNGDAVDEGGAVYGEDGPVSITGGTFTANHSGEYGGAIWNDEGLTVTGATFTDNSAADYGGAIDSKDNATISGSTFSGNTSEYGGALENDDDVRLSNSTFTSNSASEYGGAFYDDDGSPP